jgi:hypothetical protein
LDSDPNEVQVISLWDKEARKEDVYKIAYCIFSRKKFGSPSVTVMRDWLEVFMMALPQDFFLNDLKQIDNFKKWTTDFVVDKLAILLVLCQQVVDEREERK